MKKTSITLAGTAAVAGTVAAIAAAALFGCNNEAAPEVKQPVGTVIARVGNSALTLEELRANMPDGVSGVVTHEQNVQYVRQWINTELLFREAVRLGINDEPETKARLEQMKRDLLSAEVINRGMQGVGPLVSEQEIRDYYEANRTSFVREVFTVRYDRIVVDDLALAWEIRRTATHDNFREMARTHSKVPHMGVGDAVPFIPIDQIPPVERNALMGANIPSITGPYRAEDGFHVVRLLGRFDRGTIASLDEVRGEISARLSTVAQRALIDRMTDEIRAREEVEIHLNLIPGGSQDAGGGDQTNNEAEAGE